METRSLKTMFGAEYFYHPETIGAKEHYCVSTKNFVKLWNAVGKSVEEITQIEGILFFHGAPVFNDFALDAGFKKLKKDVKENEMTLIDLQKKLDNLAGENAFSVFESVQFGVIGAHLNIAASCRFDQREGTQCVGDRAVSTLYDTRDLIDQLIVKVEIAQREPELISLETIKAYSISPITIKAYSVGSDYWVNAEDCMALENYFGLDADGVLRFRDCRVIYKPELD